MSDEYASQAWRMKGYYPETYAKHSSALDMGIDYDDDRFAQYEAEFLADLAAHDREVAERAWDEGAKRRNGDSFIRENYSQTLAKNPYREASS